jgi:hypothetical protein
MKEIGAMQVIDATGGLCMTCNNAPGCYYRATRGPALFCELFDGYAPPAKRITSERALEPADSAATRRAAEEESSKYTGLCVNCRHRATCMHPRPTGGVWHCEDYD